MMRGVRAAVVAALGLLLQPRALRCHARITELDLPGWQGETYRTPLLRGGNVNQERDETKWIETIAWEPRAFVYHNFLSKEECLHLIHMAAPNMQKSAVVDNKTGKSVDSRIRTSSGTFLRKGADKVIKEIEDRIAAFAMIPADNGEGLQVLHYEEGQKYEAHFDYFHDNVNTRNGGQRIATVLMYLSDVEEGGETVFPSGTAKHKSSERFSDCGSRGPAVKPRRGDALLFWSLKTDGNLDTKSLHAGCPVIKGDKWSATKWMRVNQFNM